MKTLIAFALISFSSLSFATDIHEGDYRLDSAEGTITGVTKICPANPGGMSCRAYGSNIVVSIPLGGCLDNFAGHHHSFEVKGGKGILSFGALKMANKRSMVARCVRMPTVEVLINVAFEGKIELVNLPFTHAEIRQ